MASIGNPGLNRTSSLVHASPTKCRTPTCQPVDKGLALRTITDRRNIKLSPVKLPSSIIELTDSDTDDNADMPSTNRKKSSNSLKHTLTNAPAKQHVDTTTIILDSESEEVDSEEHDEQPRFTLKSSWSRRAVIISDSDSEDASGSNKENGEIHGLGSDDDNAAILTLNDPPRSYKPLSRDLSSSTNGLLNNVLRTDGSSSPFVHTLVSSTSTKSGVIPGSSKSRKPTVQLSVEIDESFVDDSFIQPTLPKTPSRNKIPGTKRMTKKELERQKQAQLESYAQNLFNDLNKTVFNNQLPADTALLWNKRLLTTAGKARWHRSKQNVESSSIELSTKVLDSEERIRYTLSHEMCHLASWVIDHKTDEAHGRVWKAWTKKVMKKRPDIHINTRHSYDITFKYEWQCQTSSCGKIYGRHSNSIDPKKSVCGVCKGGQLAPLFKTRARKMKADSKLAADTPQGSPSTVDKSILLLPGSFDGLRLRNDADEEKPPDSPSNACRERNDGHNETRVADAHPRSHEVLESTFGKVIAQLSTIDLTRD